MAERSRRAAGAATPADLDRDRTAALGLVDIPADTLVRLDRFVALLLDWQQRTNLIAASTVPAIWTRHIADSLQLLRLAPDAQVWVDLGSGAGFPGVVIACALAERSGTRVHLVESSAKKCAFLREAARITQSSVEVHQERIETFTRHFTGAIEVVTARALAPLPELLSLAFPLLKTGAVGLFPKGQDVAAELTAASRYWKLDAVVDPSITSPESGIVVTIHAMVAAPPTQRRTDPRPGKAQ